MIKEVVVYIEGEGTRLEIRDMYFLTMIHFSLIIVW